MNEILSQIYGTGAEGIEKQASESEQVTLSDLALALVVGDDEDPDFEKTASEHGKVLDHLASFDYAGRAMAHHEFAAMEKQAADGDDAALREFFADMIEDEQQVGDDKRAQLRAAVAAELERRQAAQ